LYNKIKIHSQFCIVPCSCEKIEAVDKIKYLGLVFDSKLTWAAHCQYLSTKLRKINFVLYHSRSILSLTHRKILYQYLFEPTLTYGISIYGGTAQNHLSKIKTLQNLALKNVLGRPKFSSASDTFALTKFFKFNQLHYIRSLGFIFRNSQLFEIITKTSRTQMGRYLLLPGWQRSHSVSQAPYVLPLLFNSSPFLIRSFPFSRSVSTFLKKVKLHSQNL